LEVLIFFLKNPKKYALKFLESLDVSSVIPHILDGWASHSMGVQYMAHRTNHVVQTLSLLSMFKII
jgi:hypothetical protein